MHIWILALLLALTVELHAQTAQEKGFAIAVEADLRDQGWIDQRANLEMILRNKQAQESRRTIRTRSLEVEGDGDKTLSIFDSPRDVKGTAFLSFSHPTTPDDQWLYLPALKRVKRIASANKSGPFMGSEFAFEDLSSNEVEKYEYRWLRDETKDGFETFVIERTPAYRYSGYSRHVVWVDKDIYKVRIAEYYDRKNALLKTLRISGYEKFNDKFWRPRRMEMNNHQTGKSTVLIWSDYRLSTGQGDQDFNKNALKRLR